jgi:hypothetical protein
VTDSDPDLLLYATGLTKVFGGLTAVDGIDFAVERGESFGFLGPNLAGKSSTMKFDSTFNVFFKLKFAKLYDSVLATPLGPRDVAVGEISWSLMRGALYAAAFLVVAWLVGTVHSW